MTDQVEQLAQPTATALDPAAPPFWELARGGGPVTRVIETRRRYARLGDIRAHVWHLTARRSEPGLRSADRASLDARLEQLRVEARQLDPRYPIEAAPTLADWSGGDDQTATEHTL